MSITTEYFQILILKSNKILKKSEDLKENQEIELQDISLEIPTEVIHTNNIVLNYVFNRYTEIMKEHQIDFYGTYSDQIYQGEELGMTNVPFNSLDDYRDIETFNSYKQLVEIEKSVSHEDMLRYMRKSSRDNARTPMQWNKGKNAGFSNQTPWIMVNPNYQTINAEAEMKDTNSIFHTYQKLTLFLRILLLFKISI